ncbi:3-oxo-tetronate kinase [Ornithinimicrobium tianjinense]|uniref:3-oxo-tetronate kinase n=1 Tax=Ornithinimicrobium tianjinense TaxID=1195761 RepID=A0A917F3L9_9MICO|nr:3-oxo-tetronate kinase [Ornithinimicrobium tianjinense]GGF41827.1 membrane protein [Ornithinimicrobium tianjinense]
MAVRLGVIADDFTGGTDMAGFLSTNGLRTVQLTGLPDPATRLPEGTEAVVVSLKSRSVPAEEAVSMSLAALAFLRAAGAERYFFKYCSTFDSTPQGNIGPVTDALLEELGEDFTVVAPSLPVNGRTTYKGHLFVGDVPLDESGMRHHPITPMTDSSLVRLMDAQSRGTTGLVDASTVADGAEQVRAALGSVRAAGHSYAVLDTVSDADLVTLGEAVSDYRLVTGGSGLGGGLARALSGGAGDRTTTWVAGDGPTVVLSGSSSQMTNRQVAAYRELAPSLAVDVTRLLTGSEGYREEVHGWVLEHAAADAPAPLVYATAEPEEVARVQQQHGPGSSAAIESFFASLARELAAAGVRRFVVAGGETSGAVTGALGVTGFEIGPQIAPGVPWVRALGSGVELALKSGNFGDPDFFATATRSA